MRRWAGSMLAAVLASLAAAGCQDATASSSGNVAHPALAARSSAVRECAASLLVLRPGPFGSAMTGEHADSFMLTNRGSAACTVSGYPQVTLYDSHGVAVPFRYATGGGAYVTAKRPATVLLSPGKSAYVLVAKYRCDLGTVDDATAIRLSLRADKGPAFAGREPVGGGVAGLSYCKGGRADPGQLVTVSPLEATFQATTSLP
jgi:Protein of unknown function (DUF4232)